MHKEQQQTGKDGMTGHHVPSIQHWSEVYNGMSDTCEATGAQEGIGVGHPLMAPGGTSWRGEVATKRSFLSWLSFSAQSKFHNGGGVPFGQGIGVTVIGH